MMHAHHQQVQHQGRWASSNLPARLSRPIVLPASQLRQSQCRAAQAEPAAEAAAVPQAAEPAVPTGGLFFPDAPVSQFVREQKQSYASPSITSTGSLRPAAEWYPAWMKYRRREDNYVFWQDKFSRNSLDIAPEEKRWTLFSTLWYLVMQTRFYAVPPALRFIIYLGWRSAMTAVYEVHKKLILLQCKLEAFLAARALGLLPEQQPQTAPTEQPSQAAAASQQPDQQSGGLQADASSGGSSMDQGEGTSAAAGSSSQGPGRLPGPGFSLCMALRRLHWRNTLLAELLYLLNVYKSGRVHMLPPKKRPLQRPTFFFLF